MCLRLCLSAFGDGVCDSAAGCPILHIPRSTLLFWSFVLITFFSFFCSFFLCDCLYLIRLFYFYYDTCLAHGFGIRFPSVQTSTTYLGSSTRNLLDLLIQHSFFCLKNFFFLQASFKLFVAGPALRQLSNRSILFPFFLGFSFIKQPNVYSVLMVLAGECRHQGVPALV